MTPKQEAFVREYLVDLNATQAAIRAGYSERTANEQGSRLLTNVSVRSAIEAAQKERGERVKATADDVLREIQRMAMYDPKVFTEVKSPLDVANLPEDARRAVVGWSWDRNGNFTLKLAKEGALEMMGRHHGLFKERLEVTGKDGGPVETLDVSALSTEALSEIMRARDAAVRR